MKRRLIKCKGADAYVGDSLPKCGCISCIKIWQAAQQERVNRANQKPSRIKDLEGTHGLSVPVPDQDFH